jgi:hypothetical protein
MAQDGEKVRVVGGGCSRTPVTASGCLQLPVVALEVIRLGKQLLRSFSAACHCVRTVFYTRYFSHSEKHKIRENHTIRLEIMGDAFKNVRPNYLN